MLIADYRVKDDLYSGPLDLMLYLVRKQEVDIREISLGRIADEFLELITALEVLDLDGIGDFLVTASALVEVKARMLIPKVEETEEVEEEEASGDLIKRLLEYRRFRDAAWALEEQAAAWQERYPRLSSDRPSERRDIAQDQIREVELWDLVSALARVVKRADAEEESSVKREDVPIGVWSDRIRARLQKEPRIAFSDFFSGEKVPSHIVGIFLAILELLRHHQYRAEQPIEYKDIYVMPPLEGHENRDTAPRRTEESEDDLDDDDLNSIELTDPE
ncbi:MAG: ScpA family protein [Planctomycetaceae bacterium]